MMKGETTLLQRLPVVAFRAAPAPRAEEASILPIIDPLDRRTQPYGRFSSHYG